MTTIEQFVYLSGDLKTLLGSLRTLFPEPGQSQQRHEFFIASASEFARQSEFAIEPLLPHLRALINVHESTKG